MTISTNSFVLFQQLVYFGRSVPWIIIDSMPYFRRWKLQPDKVPTPQEQWACTLQVLFSHLTVELPLVCKAVAQFGRKLKFLFYFIVDHAFPSHR